MRVTGPELLALWNRLSRLPGGRWLFTRLLFRLVPYSGSTGTRIERLEAGRVELSLRDRRCVRNHLRSVHAIALANVGELASGLATLSALPSSARGIVTRLEVTYHQKARGRLTVRSEVAIPAVTEPIDHRVRAAVMDEDGRVVATVTVTWRLAPVST